MAEAPEINIKLVIEYDGTHYHGWQRQPNGPSIQAEIEKAAGRITRQKITLIGSGRTDAGVHALGQTANFRCRTGILPNDLQKGLNSLLPPDIVIRACHPVDLQFHARYDAKSKLYRYAILNQALPTAIGRSYHWWIKTPLDLPAMQKALTSIAGRHDFKAFEGVGSPRAATVRHLMRAELTCDANGHLLFIFEADGFLRYMVRNLVGTLVWIGRGRLTADHITDILASKDRNRAGATAPPHGLCLMRVNY